MSTKRTVQVNGTEYVLPKLWEDEDVESLMLSFREARNDYVTITLPNGMVRVLVNEMTQVSFQTVTVKQAKARLISY